MKTKRGQAAAGAAVLLAVIAAFIILFILFIPPQERAELLDDEQSDVTEETITDTSLLSISPGRIDYLAQKEIEHPLPVVNIYTTTEPTVVAQRSTVRAKRGVFTEEVTDFPFKIDDLDNTNNVLVAFSATEVDGELILILNGQEIYNKEPANNLPISLPRDLLQRENLLTFAISSPGLVFWHTNGLRLENVQLVADVTNVDAQTSKNVVLISETEKQNLEKVKLSFQPECVLDTVGKLMVEINDNIIYDAIPDCEVRMIPIEFSPEILYQGENQIIFHTEKGRYLLANVQIITELKEVDFPTYYFDLSFEEFKDVQSEKRRLRFQLDFVDVTTTKRGDIVFNGHVRRFDTKEVSYAFDLSEDAVQGNNAIKIKPKKTLDVRELKVDLVK